MKIFISWSGEISRSVAKVLKQWLPEVVPGVTTYVSSEDMELGVHWTKELMRELEESRCGIVCVTRENLRSCWLSYEMGVLSNRMDDRRVIPFLFDVERSEIPGPFKTLQTASFEKKEIKNMARTLNHYCGNDSEKVLNAAFNGSYRLLYGRLKRLHEKIHENGIQEGSSCASDGSLPVSADIPIYPDLKSMRTMLNNRIDEQAEQIRRNYEIMTAVRDMLDALNSRMDEQAEQIENLKNYILERPMTYQEESAARREISDRERMDFLSQRLILLNNEIGDMKEILFNLSSVRDMANAEKQWNFLKKLFGSL